MSHPTGSRVAVAGRNERRVAVACILIPALLLLAAFDWLTIEHGTFRLQHVVVHESGRYTLQQTVFYFSHFLREVPVDVAYALFVLAAASDLTRYTGPHSAARGRILGWAGLGAAALLVAGAAFVAARTHGWASAASDLLQYRTRDDAGGYGSHWHFHWLSTIWFGAAAGPAMWFARRLSGVPATVSSRPLRHIAWCYVAALTLLFGASARVITDLRYVGHQAREILTHGPITLLLGIGLALALLAWLGARVPCRGRRVLPGRIALAVTLLVPAYLAVVALTRDVLTAGQTEAGLAAMVAAHAFEHLLDYALVALLVSGGLGLRAAGYRQMRGSAGAAPCCGPPSRIRSSPRPAD